MNAITQKYVMITGATAGIGLATARLFAKKGYNLVLTGRRMDRLEELKSKLVEKYACKVYILHFDVRDKDAVASAISELDRDKVAIDVLVNNAGLALGFAPVHKADIEDWEVMIDTNIKGLLYVSRLLADRMAERGSGHIINLCSTAGHEVYPNGNVYCATKYAVHALTESMRLELFDKGVRVSQVSPAAVEETEFSIVRFRGDKKRADIYSDYNPLTSKDVARVIYFIASQPKHVNLRDVIMSGTQQASSTVFDRSGRKYDKN